MKPPLTLRIMARMPQSLDFFTPGPARRHIPKPAEPDCRIAGLTEPLRLADHF
jgi:hypothetical protein